MKCKSKNTEGKGREKSVENRKGYGSQGHRKEKAGKSRGNERKGQHQGFS